MASNLLVTKILVFDFDKTLSNEDTYKKLNGDIDFKELFGGFEKVELLNKTFNKLNEKHYEIFIVTRNIEQDIKKFCDTYFNKNTIRAVIGSKNDLDCNDSKLTSDENTQRWADKKAKIINKIIDQYYGTKHVYFFDDTQANTDTVKKHLPFVQCYLINTKPNKNYSYLEHTMKLLDGLIN